MGEEHISRLLEGAPEAWADFVQCHSDRLLRMAILLVGDRDLAQDALQEGLLAAYRARRGFRGESQFYTWVTSIVINECRRFNRISACRMRCRFWWTRGGIALQRHICGGLCVRNLRSGIVEIHIKHIKSGVGQRCIC